MTCIRKRKKKIEIPNIKILKFYNDVHRHQVSKKWCHIIRSHPDMVINKRIATSKFNCNNCIMIVVRTRLGNHLNTIRKPSHIGIFT